MSMTAGSELYKREKNLSVTKYLDCKEFVRLLQFVSFIYKEIFYTTITLTTILENKPFSFHIIYYSYFSPFIVISSTEY